MDDSTGRTIAHRYVTAEPRVRAACDALADRYGLRWHDRKDLEQELWLALAAEWHRRDSVGGNKIGVADSDALLANEMDWLWGHWLGGSSSNDFGAGDDPPPLLAGTLPCPRLVSPNNTSTDAIRLIDLRLDIAEVIDRLPVEDRGCCHRLIAALNTTVHTPLAEPFPFGPSHLDALRLAFETHGLRDYL